MQVVSKFQYTTLSREDGGEDGRKYVDPQGNRLPSVTTILDRTKPDEAKAALAAWRRRMGEKKAAEIVKEAAFRGTMMHKFLERTLNGEDPKPGSNFYHQHSFKMSQVILETYLKPFMDEVWGLETNLYYPELYAGTTDLTGLYQGTPSIVDFKQTNQPKTDERVEDYKLQLVAYANAHNRVYGTDIQQGVILMCSKDLAPQSWIVRGEEFKEYSDKWWQRVAEYHKV
jgi:ATP-dependent exoDNAse (exonuclease V) beta subunit